MSASSRITKGFSRLATFLAFSVSLFLFLAIGLEAFNDARRAGQAHVDLVEAYCAHKLSRAPFDRALSPTEVIPLAPGKSPAEINWKFDPPEGLTVLTNEGTTDPRVATYDLEAMGCAEVSRRITWQEIEEAQSPGDDHYTSILIGGLAWGFGFALFVGICIYSLIRSIGWVIAGFART